MKRTFLKIIFFGAFVAGSFCAGRLAFAEDKYSIKEMTPEVQTALDSRRDRFDQLKTLKAQGAVGENNQGYVQVLTDDASAKGLVEAENRDRHLIYKTIEKQNGLTNAMETIEKVFGQVQRDKASSGDKIQDDNGNWISK